jgi:hypothetical protein
LKDAAVQVEASIPRINTDTSVKYQDTLLTRAGMTAAPVTTEPTNEPENELQETTTAINIFPDSDLQKDRTRHQHNKTFFPCH